MYLLLLMPLDTDSDYCEEQDSSSPRPIVHFAPPAPSLLPSSSSSRSTAIPRIPTTPVYRHKYSYPAKDASILAEDSDNDPLPSESTDLSHRRHRHPSDNVIPSSTKPNKTAIMASTDSVMRSKYFSNNGLPKTAPAISSLSPSPSRTAFSPPLKRKLESDHFPQKNSKMRAIEVVSSDEDADGEFVDDPDAYEPIILDSLPSSHHLKSPSIHLPTDDDESPQKVRKANNTHKKRIVDADDDDADYVEEITSEPSSPTNDEKLVQLMSMFPNYSAALLEKVLSSRNYNLDSAIEKLMKSQEEKTMSNPKPVKLEKKKAKGADSDSEEEYDPGSASDNEYNNTSRDHEEDSDEEFSIEALARMEETLKFFNTASVDDLQDYTSCTADQAFIIINSRPFNSIDDIENKLTKQKGVSAKILASYDLMTDALHSVDRLIGQVDSIGKDLVNIIRKWSHDSNEFGDMLIEGDTKDTDVKDEVVQDSDEVSYQLRQQPELISENFKLKKYQLIGVSWLYLLWKKGLSGILADDMGLGKTSQVISLIAHLLENGETGPHLIIVPSSTLDNWLREFKRWVPSDLYVKPYHGSQSERFHLREEILASRSYHVILTTYNIATGSKEDRSFLRKMKFKSMILDEGHMIKNVTSQRYKYLMNIGAQFRLLLTGTPLQNNLQELMALLTFILPDIFLEDRSWEHIFNNKPSSRPDSFSTTRISKVQKIIAPFVLRRKKIQVLSDLPQKIEKVEYCTLPPGQRSLYDSVLSEGRKSLNSSKKIQNTLMDLRKAACHPLLFRRHYTDSTIRKMSVDIMKEEPYWDADSTYIFEDMQVCSDFELHSLCKKFPRSLAKYKLESKLWMESAKVQKLQEVLEQCKMKGDRCLVFSQFTMILDILEEVLNTLGMKYIRLDGQTNVADRQVLIDLYTEDESIFVFLLSTKAGGLGLNLTAANVVILHDMDFNPHNDNQAEDRAWRLGQTRDVQVVKLLCKETIEETIYNRAKLKLQLDKQVMNSNGSANNSETGMDIMKLLMEDLTKGGESPSEEGKA